MAASADPNAARLGGWRVALRIARRDARRSRGRSALVLVMIGLPVLLSTAIAVLVSTADRNEVERLPQRLGSTQAELRDSGGRAPVIQDPLATNVLPADDQAPPDPTALAPLTVAELVRLTGGQVVRVDSGSTVVAVRTGRASVNLLQTDADLRLLRGKVDVLVGRQPDGPDEVLVDRTLQDRGFGIGSDLRLGPEGTTASVVGVARFADNPGFASVLARPGLLPAGLVGDGQFLLNRPTPVTWDEVLTLNRSGVAVYSRAVVLDPPPADRVDPRIDELVAGGAGAQDRAVLVIVVTSVMLEVVLLAGPAFAVGVRRQQRQLALLAATGADRAHVRRVVLAGGLVLGIGASLAGAVLGLGLAVAVVAVTRNYREDIFGPFEISWPAVAAAVVLGVVAAVAAALVPARQAARLDVVAALTGRRAEARVSRGWPVVGAALAAIGALLTLTLGTRPGGETTVAFGTIIAVLGLVALMPLLVGLVGRTARRLPVPLRIAVRDGARHRTRTAPAVAAVMGVMAGMTAVAIGGASDAVERRMSYAPELAMGATRLTFNPGAELDRVTAAGQRVLPGSRWMAVGTVGGVPNGSLEQPPAVAVVPAGCSVQQVTVFDPDHQACSFWQVEPSKTAQASGYNGVVAPVEALPALQYSPSAEQLALLREGGLLVSNPKAVRPDGTAEVITYRYSGDGSSVTGLTRKSVPASYLGPQVRGGQPFGFGLVATPATAEALGLPWAADQAVLVSGERLTPQQEIDLGDAVRAADDSASAYTERGFRDDLQVPFLILAVAAAIAVLVGTLTATGLALADARPDLATLAAIGASPRSRRVMAGSHALVIGLLGTLTGTALGFLPGIAVTYPLTTFQGRGPYLDVPWRLLLLVAVAVPLLAAAVAAVSHRTRQPLTRRI